MTTAAARKTLKPADNKPFDFNLDAVEAEVDLTPWRVHFGGQRWVFKHPQEIDVWDVVAEDEAAGPNGMSANASMLAVFKCALGDVQYKEFRKIRPLENFRLEQLMKAYKAYGGVKEGESEGSTDS